MLDQSRENATPRVQNQQLEMGICSIALGFLRERAAVCPLLETLQANKNIEGGRTSKSRLLEHFKGFKDSGRNFLNFLPKRHSSIYISSIALTLKYYDTTKLHQPAL